MASSKPEIPEDAIELLMSDHQKVKELFAEFKKFHDAKQQGGQEFMQALMDAVCLELKVHTTIEEEVFYPAVRAALKDEDDLLNEALVEHHGAKDLIAEIEAGSASDAMTCARFMVLSEQIEHHVKEEHQEMFPKVRESSVDTKAIGKKMKARKEELTKSMGDGHASVGMPPGPGLWERFTSLRR